MVGETPTDDFLNRSLYLNGSLHFHYPRYRSSVPLSVVVKGQHKLVYAWGVTIRMDLKTSDPKMLFDLANDPGEFHDITPDNPELAEILWKDLDSYLTSVDARLPRASTAAYRGDNGVQFEADNSADRRDTFPPFEGSRKPSLELNDAPQAPFRVQVNGQTQSTVWQSL